MSCSTHLFLLLSILSVTLAENYAFIYGSYQSVTDLGTPSTPCKMYNYLNVLGFNQYNTIYMVNTENYDTDWSNFYKSYSLHNNLFLRDSQFYMACGDIDFSGSYVTPHFLMSYLSGDYEEIKKVSGINHFKRFNFKDGDNVLIYISDTNGRGSQFIPQNVLSSDEVQNAIQALQSKANLKSIVFFVEASYGDEAFYRIDNMKNVIAFTLKDVQQKGSFSYYQGLEGSNTILRGAWDSTWATLLPYVCDKKLITLVRMAHLGGIVMATPLEKAGTWGDKTLLSKSFSDLYNIKSCVHIFKEKVMNCTDQETFDKIIKKTIQRNLNTNKRSTVDTQIMDYYKHIDKVLRQIVLSEPKPIENTQASIEECGLSIYNSMLQHCDYLIPLPDSYVTVFAVLCASRENENLLQIDFESFCKKQ